MAKCKFCGQMARETATYAPKPTECDRCWEVIKRVGPDMPLEVLEKIIREARGPAWFMNEIDNRVL